MRAVRSCKSWFCSISKYLSEDSEMKKKKKYSGQFLNICFISGNFAKHDGTLCFIIFLTVTTSKYWYQRKGLLFGKFI